MNKMNSQNISDNLINAMDIIMNHGLDKAKFDKTIPVQIIKCIDSRKGIYRVKHQDAVYNATAATTDTQYKEGDEVYITIPEGDMSKNKKIVGEVAAATETHNIKDSDTLNKYYNVGSSVVNSGIEEFGLCSFAWYNREQKVHDLEILYQNNNVEKISVDNDSFIKILQEEGCDHFGIEGSFKTSLIHTQRENGDYGLKVVLIYENEGVESKHEFILNVDMMTGNPYALEDWAIQSAVYEVPQGAFKRIESIVFFSDDFANKEVEGASNPDDIFIKDIKIHGMALADAPYFNTYTLGLNFSAGNILSLQNPKTTVTPEVYYHGEPVNTGSFEFYWFRENSMVNTGHVAYNQKGGQSWECLNKDHLSEPFYEISRNSTYAPKQVKYKCVAVLDSSRTTEQIFYISDNDYTHSIELTADNTAFKNRLGAATMECKVIPRNSSSSAFNNLQYSWHKKQSSGVVIRLNELNETTNGEGDSFNPDVLNYDIQLTLNDLIDFINTNLKQGNINPETYFGQFVANNSSTTLNNILKRPAYKKYIENALKNILEADDLYNLSYRTVLEGLDILNARYYITYIKDGVYHELPAAKISSADVYGCTVYAIDGNGNYIYLGSESISLSNKVDSNISATLNIIGGEQIFKYDLEGRSPTIQTDENLTPQTIQALTFTLFDDSGIQIHDAKIFDGPGSVVSEWEWRVPVADSFIQLSEELATEDKISEDGNYYCIKGLKALPFTIRSLYSEFYNQNKIHLMVVYQDKILRASTNFLFTKDGSNGTNGTDYICKVSPNIDEGLEEYPALTFEGASSYLNYTPEQPNQWFKADLWRNGELVTELDDANLHVDWKILTNQYESNGQVYSTGGQNLYYDYSEEDGFTATNHNNFQHPSLITQAAITYTLAEDNTQIVYGSIPLSVIMLNDNNYKVRIDPTSGFNRVVYDADGKKPSYANRDFKVQVFEPNVNPNDDISNSLNFEFSIFGFSNLLKLKLNEEKSNACSIQVLEGYNGYDTNMGLKCVVYKNESTIATIYHPIHMMLSRYGLSALNPWDGNSIEVNDAGTVLLAPQIGAGYKEEDNSFTGMIMGTLREVHTDEQAGESLEDKTGLLGFKSGEQTLFLDAETGRAEFGHAGKGQIILDPGTEHSQIFSGNYSETNKEGLLIDLTLPEIRYGSGNFKVDKDGHLFAQNADIKGIIRATKIQMVKGDSEESFDEYLNGAIQNNIQDSEEIKDYIDSVIGDIEFADEQQITWFGTANPPTADNEPAQNWDDAAKIDHIDDLYYNTNTKKCFRWIGAEWESFNDPDIENALEKAKDAKDLADKKRRTFTGETTPEPPYDLGDLWLQGDKGEILYCIEDRTENEQGSTSDWAKSNKYTNDDALTNFINSKYNPFVTDIKGQIDGKAEVWYQSTDPSDNTWGKEHKGDLWHYTGATGTVNGVEREGNSEWVWETTNNGSTWSWQPMEVPDSIWDTLDGKANIYTSLADIDKAMASDSPPQENDLFIPAATEGEFKKGRVYRYGYATTPYFIYTVEDVSGATYGFKLNNNGYYESQNKSVNNSFAICRVSLNVKKSCKITFKVINYAEKNRDYGFFGKLDTALELKNTLDSSSNVQMDYSGINSTTVQTLEYINVPTGNHFIDVKFIKNNSSSMNNDSLQFKMGDIPVDTGLGWVDTGVASVDDVQTGGFEENFEKKVLEILNNGSGETEITADYVISPSIGGGYLNITSGDYRTVIDPANKGGNGASIFKVSKTITGDETILMGIDNSGNATFKGNITASTITAGSSLLIGDEESGTFTKITNTGLISSNYFKFQPKEDNKSAYLLIGDMTGSTLGRNMHIDDSSINIRNGETILATFQDNLIELGKNSQQSKINFCNGLGELSYTSETQKVEISDGVNVSYTQNGLSLKSNLVSLYSLSNNGHYAKMFNGIFNNDNPIISLKASDGIQDNLTYRDGFCSEIWVRKNDIQLISQTDWSHEGLKNVDVTLSHGEVFITSDEGLVFNTYTGSPKISAFSDANEANIELLRAASTDGFSTVNLIVGDGLLNNSYGGNTDINGRTHVRFHVYDSTNGTNKTQGIEFIGSSRVFQPRDYSKGLIYLGTESKPWKVGWAKEGFKQASDARQKENILRLGESDVSTFSLRNNIDIHSELFDRLKPVQFNFINSDDNRIYYGLLAQEVAESMAELGIEENELDLVHHSYWTDEETGEEKDSYGMAYTNLIPMLIHEVQKLKEQIKQLQEER